MKYLAAFCAVLVVSGLGCASQMIRDPVVHDVRIRVENETKKTKVPRVRYGYRRDTIRFAAEAGPVTIIIPTGDFEVVEAPDGALDDHGHWISLQLEETQTAVLLIPDDFPDNRHDPGKNRVVWYLVICGTGADAYPGEDESPPRIIIRPR